MASEQVCASVKERSTIEPQIEAFVEAVTDRWENPDANYHGNFKYYEYQILESFEEAEAFLEDQRRVGDYYDKYKDGAVRYYETGDQLPKKVTDLKKRYEALQKEYRDLDYRTKPHRDGRKSKTIGCTHCGRRSYIADLRNTQGKCPGCYGDLRSKTVINKLEALSKRRDEAKSRYEAAKAEAGKKLIEAGKAEVMWCVLVSTR